MANSWFNKQKIINKLNLFPDELNYMVELNHIQYSSKINKFNIDSVLQKRTMTIGLDNLIDDKLKEILLNKMQNQSSFIRYLFSQMQKGNSFTANECAIIGQNDFDLMSYEALSSYSFAKGKFDSSDSWRIKKIENLEKKIQVKENELKEIIEKNKHKDFHQNFVKGKKKQLALLKSKLDKAQSIDYLPTWFGNHNLSDLDLYHKSRMALFIQGEELKKGNRNIRIEYDKNHNYQLSIYKQKFPIKIPNSHTKTFTLDGFNRQASNICFNRKGKLVLNLTYSYIKPIPLYKKSHSKGMVGIDIGPKEIAVCFVKKDGNPFKYIHYSIGNLLDKKSDDSKRELSLILDKIIRKAIHYGFYQFTIENLNFKDNFRYKSRNLNRMLHKFPYKLFEDLIESKCYRNGIHLKKINPAYTSIIGLFKYANRDNLCTSHNAKSKDLSAALVIGRRGLGFHEKAIATIKSSGKLISIPIKSILSSLEDDDNKSNWESKKSKSNWSLWSKLSKITKNIDELTALFHANPLPFIVDQMENGILRCKSSNQAPIKIGVDCIF